MIWHMSKKTKYYYDDPNSEICYTLNYFIENAKEKNLNEIELYEAIPFKDTFYMFCRSVNLVGEKEGCGKFCEFYSPRNKKSGICKHRSNILYEVGEKVTIKIKKDKNGI